MVSNHPVQHLSQFCWETSHWNSVLVSCNIQYFVTSCRLILLHHSIFTQNAPLPGVLSEATLPYEGRELNPNYWIHLHGNFKKVMTEIYCHANVSHQTDWTSWTILKLLEHLKQPHLLSEPQAIVFVSCFLISFPASAHWKPINTISGIKRKMQYHLKITKG